MGLKFKLPCCEKLPVFFIKSDSRCFREDNIDSILWLNTLRNKFILDTALGYVYINTCNNQRLGSAFDVTGQALSSLPSWMPDTCPKIHSCNQHCPMYSRLQSVLGVHSFYVKRNNYILKFSGIKNFYRAPKSTCTCTSVSVKIETTLH